MRSIAVILAAAFALPLTSREGSSDVWEHLDNADLATAQTVKHEGVTLTIRHGEPVSTTASSPAIDALFYNGTSEPVTVIDPQDGSEHGWLPPHYDWRVVSTATNNHVELLDRCGMYGGRYNSKTMHVIAPGETTTLKLSAFCGWTAGEYEVQLTYHVPQFTYYGERHRMQDGGLAPVGCAWPRGVFVGKLQSEKIRIRVEEIDERVVPRLVAMLESPETDRRCMVRVLERSAGLDA